MSPLDYLILLLVALSMLMGFLRGFVREAASLATWVLAVWAAWRLSWVAAPLVDGWLDGSPGAALWVARALMFVAVLIAGALAGFLLGRIVKGTGLSGTDRMLGVLFGFGRGAVVVGLLVVVGQAAGFSADPWWAESRLMPYGERMAARLRLFADEAGDQLRVMSEAVPAADGRGE